MNRTDTFIQLYNQLDEHLAQLTGEDTKTSFYVLVEKAVARGFVRKREEATLKKYGSLRNLIVHDAEYPARAVAEPTEETVKRFKQIAQRLMDPPRLGDFRREVRLFAEDDKLADALRHMRENNFSQVVVRGEALSVLTTEGVAKWLEQQVEADVVSVADATVGDALSLEPPGVFHLMSRRDTFDAAQEVFVRAPLQGKPRLYAVIVTENGRPHEIPLGLVTPWDVIEDD